VTNTEQVTTEQVPLTWALTLLDQMDRKLSGQLLHARFSLSMTYRLSGPLDENALRQALDDLIARHGALRSVFVREGERAYQRAYPPMPARLTTTQLDPAVSPEKFTAEACDHDCPLDDLPLLWAHLGRYSESDALLVLLAHHAGVDAWSLWILGRDLTAAYTARLRGASPLGADVMQYADIARDDRSEGSREQMAKAMPYWRERLRDIGDQGVLAESDGTPSAQRIRRFAVDDRLRQALTVAARRARTTPFTLMLTAFAATMYPLGTARWAYVPVVTSGRPAVEWNTVGFLVNVLPVCVDLHGVASLDELRARVDQTCREAYVNEVSLVHLINEIPALGKSLIRRDRVAPTFQLVRRPPLTWPTDRELIVEPVNENALGTAMPMELAWTMRLDETLVGHAVHNPNLFSDEWVTSKIETYVDLLWDLAGGRG
jgi:hypothetical protein